jgi:uncharacterized secreted protein with C-terminal beta-propeller domain
MKDKITECLVPRKLTGRKISWLLNRTFFVYYSKRAIEISESVALNSTNKCFANIPSVMFISNTKQTISEIYMEDPNVITVKVPGELKKKMKQVKVNWSQYIRECVQNKIEQQDMMEASAKLDEIRRRTKPTSTEEIVSWIREDRDNR